MITLYGYASSPNVLKVRILLEEAAIPYVERDIHREQDDTSCQAKFLESSPTGAVPSIEDSDTQVTMFESSAILLYISDKSGQLLPIDQKDRAEVFKWLIYESASISPLFEAIYKLYMISDDWAVSALAFHQKELIQRLNILDQQLSKQPFIARQYSIADIALFPLINMAEDFTEQPISETPHIASWLKRVQQHEAVQRAIRIATTIA